MDSQSGTKLSAKQNAVIQAAKLDLVGIKPPVLTPEAERADVSRNFASDTVTAPTIPMLKYASEVASLGDDVFKGDWCTNQFEEHVAKLFGKEAGVFVSSGTMGNQLAVRCLLDRPPYSVLTDHRAHVYVHEAGGISLLSGAATITVVPSNGRYLSLEDVKSNVVFDDSNIHCAPTQVICLENTLSGAIHPQKSILAIAEFAKANGIKLHLDGARIWHVAIETGIPLEELCAPFDTVSVCFSKGLGAPAGSILVGSKPTIDRARHFRKMFGGGMRQIGILSACAAYSLTNHYQLLPQVHQKAKYLAMQLQKLGVKITYPVDTCMVFFDASSLGLDYAEIQKRMEALDQPIRMFPWERLVLHIQTSDQAIEDFVSVIKAMAEEKKRQGFTGKKSDTNKIGEGVYSKL